ncbi:unnamed protein product [Brassica rapa]|uniref:Uncharacterized protein n=1 Tax=Brassica campestris TaxID=3711 RepID=A0A8D9CV99_BRACM|nr:unnamed protein product [Brassica rapa]
MTPRLLPLIWNNDDIEEVMMIHRQRRRPTHKEVEDGGEL